MPEGSGDAAILIATSWQALNRALREGPDTSLCNCTVVVLFSGFYLEANLNYVIEQLHKNRQMKAFLNQRHPGLRDKTGMVLQRVRGSIEGIHPEGPLRHRNRNEVAATISRVCQALPLSK